MRNDPPDSPDSVAQSPGRMQSTRPAPPYVVGGRAGESLPRADSDKQTENGAGQFAYSLTLKATGEGPPAIIRLRHFLKAALRQYGLRCIACEELKQ